MSSSYDIRRRTAEKMAKPVIAQPALEGVEPEQLPKHIPPTARAKLAAIRERCAARIEAAEPSESTVDESTLDRPRR